MNTITMGSDSDWKMYICGNSTDTNGTRLFGITGVIPFHHTEIQMVKYAELTKWYTANGDFMGVRHNFDTSLVTAKRSDFLIWYIKPIAWY